MALDFIHPRKLSPKTTLILHSARVLKRDTIISCGVNTLLKYTVLIHYVKINSKTERVKTQYKNIVQKYKAKNTP